jgi:hypothetical protein
MTDQQTTEERIARRLCAWAEYHEGNWQLYLPKARELIALMERA